MYKLINQNFSKSRKFIIFFLSHYQRRRIFKKKSINKDITKFKVNKREKYKIEVILVNTDYIK